MFVCWTEFNANVKMIDANEVSRDCLDPQEDVESCCPLARDRSHMAKKSARFRGSCVPAAATIQGGTYSGTAAGSAGNLLLVGSVSIRPVKWKYPCRL